MQPHVQSQFDVRENPRSTLRSVRLAVRERILATSCACMYPSLPVDKRLTSTALFIRHIFRARFPGTATDVTIFVHHSDRTVTRATRLSELLKH